MNTLHRQRTSGYAGLTGLFLAVAAVAQGCGNDNPEPTTPVITGGTNTGGSGATGGKGGKGGSGGDAGADTSPGGNDATGGTTSNTGGSATGGTGAKGGKGGTGGKGATGGTGNASTGGTRDVGNEGGAANSGNEGGTGAVPVDCSAQGQGKDRCYPCAPTDGENVEFLNHCNGTDCSYFDNESRIEGLTDPLPSL
jgi:hypothetical protein